MKLAPIALLFATLGVASARIGESVNDSYQDETRNLEEIIEIDFDTIPTNTNVTPGGGGGTVGGPNDNVRVMVGYKNEQGKLTAIATELSELITVFKTVNVLTMTIPSTLVDILANVPNIEYVEEDGVVFMAGYGLYENVPYGIPQAQGDSAGLPPAPSTSGACSDPNSFKVAVIDSGLEVAHPDVPCLPIDASDTNCKGVSIGVNGEPWYAPQNNGYHGTHVFGTIGATGGNEEGVTGMVPDSGGICYLTARVFDDAGNGQYFSRIFEAIDWAIDEGADVINMSLGGGGMYRTGQATFDEAYKRGTLSVAAAGNNGSSQLSYPASYEKVISVAAVDSNKERAYFSQSNAYVDISAAGVSVESTFLNGRYAYLSGTSMATPHVVGSIARIWSTCRECSNDQVEQCLLNTAEDLGPVGRDNDYGAGLLQTQNAYDCLVNTNGCCGAPVACRASLSTCASNEDCCSDSCSLLGICI